MTSQLLQDAAPTMLAAKRTLEGRELPPRPTTTRGQIGDFLARHRGEQFTGIEIAAGLGLASTAAHRQSVYETLPRMSRLDQVERRLITDEEIAKRGAGRHTLWLWWVS